MDENLSSDVVCFWRVAYRSIIKGRSIILHLSLFGSVDYDVTIYDYSFSSVPIADNCLLIWCLTNKTEFGACQTIIFPSKYGVFSCYYK